jgi:hypothetical protein
MLAVGLNSSAVIVRAAKATGGKLLPIPAVVTTPVPDISSSDLPGPETSPPSVKFLEPDAPPEVLIVVLAPIAIGVLLSPIDVVPLLVILPAKVIELGAVAVKPAEKVLALELDAPICNVPVFAKVVLSVIELVLPVRLRL